MEYLEGKGRMWLHLNEPGLEKSSVLNLSILKAYFVRFHIWPFCPLSSLFYYLFFFMKAVGTKAAVILCFLIFFFICKLFSGNHEIWIKRETRETTK